MATESLFHELGTAMPEFELLAVNPEVEPRAQGLCASGDFEEPVLVVLFICNHCPYVQHVEPVLISLAKEFKSRGVAFVAISSNDPEAYSAEDGPEFMAQRAREKGYPFPYLYDESQEVAREFGAMCTPDVFVYNGERKLVYHGRIDETRPKQGREAHGGELRNALETILSTGEGPAVQHPCIGCSIKWRQD